MGTFGQFSRRMNIQARGLPEAINRLVRAVALAADQAIVLATPVDTGNARSNWVVGLNAPVTSERDPYAPGSRLGIGEQANAQAAMEHARQVVSARGRGQSVWISNNVDYIGKLNEGFSRQAPANFVEMGVLAAVEAAKRGKLLI